MPTFSPDFFTNMVKSYCRPSRFRGEDSIEPIAKTWAVSNFWVAKTTKNRVGGNRDVWSYHDWITNKITIFHWNLRMVLILPTPTESHQLVQIHQVHPFCLARSRGWFSCVRISRKLLWKRKKVTETQKPKNISSKLPWASPFLRGKKVGAPPLSPFLPTKKQPKERRTNPLGSTFGGTFLRRQGPSWFPGCPRVSTRQGDHLIEWKLTN